MLAYSMSSRRSAVRLALLCCLLVMAGSVGLVPGAGAATLDVGYRDHKFAPSIQAATGDKPQSKLWYAAGRWWGVLWDAAAGHHTIHGFNLATQTTNAWTSTGVRVDPRPNSQTDVLWDNRQQKLYVVTHLKQSDTATADKGLRFLRFGYGNGTYSTEVSQTLLSGQIEAAVMDKDSTGVLWVTFTEPTGTKAGGRYVRVMHTTTSDTAWTAPFTLPVTSSAVLTAADDISAVVAYGDAEGRKIGVLWSNQKADAMYFASHVDGAPDSAWTLTELCRDTYCPDDHVNIKSVDADPSGNVYAVVKTANNDKTTVVPSDPLIVVYRLSPTGAWTSSTAWTVAEGNMTRAILVLDSENRRVYTFAAPCCNGGPVYMKDAPFETLDFPRGNGTVLMRSGATTEKINNPTSTKQSVTSSTGLLVVASIQSTREYVHNYLALGGTPPAPDTQPPTVTAVSPADGSADVPVAGNASATFSEAMDPATLTGSTFTLESSSGSPVPAAVGYDPGTRRVTLDPSADLTGGTWYTAVVKGGPGGAKDVAGNALMGDRAWTFTTASPSGGGAAETVTLTAVAGGYVSADAPGANYGTSLVMKVDKKPQRVTYLKFDLSQYASRSLQRAQLRLRTAASASSGTQTVKRVADDTWTEETLTYGNRPALDATVLGSLGPTTGNTDYTISLGVDSLVGDVGGVLSLALDSSHWDGLDITSDETATPPRLVLVLE